MKTYLRLVLNDQDFAREMANRALETIRGHHTCSHRVKQLLRLCRDIGAVETTDQRHAPGQNRAFADNRFTTNKVKKGGKHLHAVN